MFRKKKKKINSKGWKQYKSNLQEIFTSLYYKSLHNTASLQEIKRESIKVMGSVNPPSCCSMECDGYCLSLEWKKTFEDYTYQTKLTWFPLPFFFLAIVKKTGVAILIFDPKYHIIFEEIVVPTRVVFVFDTAKQAKDHAKGLHPHLKLYKRLHID